MTDTIEKSDPGNGLQKAGVPHDPPILECVMPVLILISSIVYAISLIGIREPTMNLLLLKPLFVVLWVLLAVVVLREVIPSLRRRAAWRAARADRPRRTLRARFAPRTQMGALMVLLATFAFAVIGPGRGMIAYLVALFLYVIATGLLMGDRRPTSVLGRAVIITLVIYVVMIRLLGVRF